MIQTIEAIIEPSGEVRLLGDVRVPAARRALLTILEEPAKVPETALLAEQALSDWLRPEEEAAWSHLQSGK